MAKVIQIIEAEVTRGNCRETVVRSVKQYWSFDGVLLAEVDPCCSVKVVVNDQLQVFVDERQKEAAWP